MSFGEEARLTIHPLCVYPSFDTATFRDDDWKARYIVKAVKHDMDALSRAFVWLGNPPSKYNHENYPRLVSAFHRWAAETLKELGIQNPVLAAVPNSNAIVGADGYPTKLAVEGIAREYGEGCVAYTGLRFDQILPKARLGGSRNKYELLGHLRITDAPPGGSIVLFDDVCSSGAHLFAAQRALAPFFAVEHAICCGRTVHGPMPSALKLPPETIVTYW